MTATSSPLFSRLFHPDLLPLLSKMSFFDSLIFFVVTMVDRFDMWHRLPVLLGLAYLGLRRHLHQKYNLIHVGPPEKTPYDAEEVGYRTADGTCNDPSDGRTGGSGTFFGRNMPPTRMDYGLLDPHPSIVAAKLLERKKFVDCGDQFNLIGCAWIQFMIHDWIDHLEDTQQVEIRAPKAVADRCPLKSFKFFKTKSVSMGSESGFLNTRTPWWDGSVVYGNNEEGMRRVRKFKDGKLKITEEDGLLQHDGKGIPISGDVRNCWAGFSLLQALFVKEHNAVCDMLKTKHPEFDDERLYRHARLVTSAVIAKIHTIDWTIELLKTDTLVAGMRVNWYGFLGKRLKDLCGSAFGPVLSGLVGLKRPRNHGVPYSLTEEFSSVYRMHTLLPEKVLLRDIGCDYCIDHEESLPIQEEVPMKEMIGLQGERRLSEIGMEKMLISMGYQSSGAIALWNYPSWMRNLIAHDVNGEDRPDPVDMAALEIYRDRERKVARYNEFRRNLLMVPIRRWEDLVGDDWDAVDALREVYGNDVEKLDLQVGLHAEKKIKGFAIGETSFFIFLLIASRRLEADRFFTTNFNAKTYTEEGLNWVNKTESLKDVIDRHFPGMTNKYMRCTSAFSVWDSPPDPKRYLPLYLRLAT